MSPRITIAALALTSLSALGLAAPLSPANAAATSSAATVFKGKVTANGGLAQRVAPSTHLATSGTAFKKGAIISIECQLNGTSVDGNGRWYKISGKNRWVAARYVSNIGKAPYACTAGDWDFTVYVAPGTNIRQGPSTKDRKIGSLAEGAHVSTRWITRNGEAVGGVTDWIAVETPTGNRGWINKGNLRLVG